MAFQFTDLVLRMNCSTGRISGSNQLLKMQRLKFLLPVGTRRIEKLFTKTLSKIFVFYIGTNLHASFSAFPVAYSKESTVPLPIIPLHV